MTPAVPLILVILCLTTANLFLPFVSAAAYMPGVKVGNFIKFGVSESYSSDDPNLQAEPQFLKDIDNTAFIRADVLNVSGTSVTYTMTTRFNNATADKVITLVENVNTGAGNAIEGGITFVFIAAGLNPGDKVANNASAPIIDNTERGTFAGASRYIDVLASTGPINPNVSLTASQSWDQETGVLTELSFYATQKSGPSRQYTTNWSDLLTAKETNIWSTSNTGISPTLLYAILGAVGATTALAGVIVFTRMRKTHHTTNVPHSTPATVSPDLSNLVQCNRCHGYNLPGAYTCRHCGAQTRA